MVGSFPQRTGPRRFECKNDHVTTSYSHAVVIPCESCNADATIPEPTGIQMIRRLLAERAA